MEANASADQDVIAIGVAGPIVLNAALPPITDNGLVITGSGQQISMTAPNVAFWVNADGVQFNNLIIDGAERRHHRDCDHRHHGRPDRGRRHGPRLHH